MTKDIMTKEEITEKPKVNYVEMISKAMQGDKNAQDEFEKVLDRMAVYQDKSDGWGDMVYVIDNQYIVIRWTDYEVLDTPQTEKDKELYRRIDNAMEDYETIKNYFVGKDLSCINEYIINKGGGTCVFYTSQIAELENNLHNKNLECELAGDINEGRGGVRVTIDATLYPRGMVLQVEEGYDVKFDGDNGSINFYGMISNAIKTTN